MCVCVWGGGGGGGAPPPPPPFCPPGGGGGGGGVDGSPPAPPSSAAPGWKLLMCSFLSFPRDAASQQRRVIGRPHTIFAVES